MEEQNMIKYFISFLFWCFVCKSYAQSTIPFLEIDSVLTEYSMQDSVCFHFCKKCEDKIFISISLERRENDKWLLFVEDIFQIPSVTKSKVTISLKENVAEIKEKWKIKRNMYKKGKDNVYRFRYNVIVYKNSNKMSYTEHSNIFNVISETDDVD